MQEENIMKPSSHTNDLLDLLFEYVSGSVQMRGGAGLKRTGMKDVLDDLDDAEYSGVSGWRPAGWVTRGRGRLGPKPPKVEEHPDVRPGRRVDPAFVSGEKLGEDHIEELQAKYEKLVRSRTSYSPTNLRSHVGGGWASVFVYEHGGNKSEDKSSWWKRRFGRDKNSEPQNAAETQNQFQSKHREYAVGFWVNDIFIVSHLASSPVFAIPLLKQLRDSITPVVFFVPSKLASMLTRLGFHDMEYEIDSYYKGSTVVKSTIVNNAFTHEDEETLYKYEETGNS